MTWTVALDVLMAVLLATSIATTIVFSRRLNSMREDRAELEELTRHFREATDRADQGVVGLKVTAQTLQERIEAARAMADDLHFLIERGGGIADRLETEVRASRRAEPRAKPAATASSEARAKPANTASSEPRAKPRDTGQPRSAAELHLLAALRKRA